MPKNTVTYDWVIETLDPKTSEILDVEHVDTYPGPVKGCDVGLVRDKGNEEDGLVERQWAYVARVLDSDPVEYTLPERFDIAGVVGVPVPYKFHREVRAWHKKNK
jgi:hypothetical protein